MAAVLELPEMEHCLRKQENGQGSSTASELTSPTVASAGQTPPAEDFDPEVDTFLERYPFLRPILQESLDPLRKIFGETAPLAVYVETDPEVDDWEYLVIALRTTFSADQAQAQLDAFGAAWWLEQLPRAQGKLLFTLEFV
jgi:hypothetical protein